jgi:DNA-binding CsgD family transcriptional regulator
MNRLPSKAHLGASVRSVLGATAEKIEPLYEKVFSTGTAELHYEFSGGLPNRREQVDWVLSLFPVARSPSNIGHVAAIVLDTTIVRRLERHLRLFQPLTFPISEPNGSSLPPQMITDAPASPLLTLTKREVETLKLLASGNSNKQVAATLCLSVRTVESHRARIMLKLHVHSVPELVRFAIRNSVVPI